MHVRNAKAPNAQDMSLDICMEIKKRGRNQKRRSKQKAGTLKNERWDTNGGTKTSKGRDTNGRTGNGTGFDANGGIPI